MSSTGDSLPDGFQDDANQEARVESASRSYGKGRGCIGASLRRFTRPSGTLDKQQHARWRHALGISFLMATVFLWTASNFLGSTIFADNSYSKPFFVTIINSSAFLFPLAGHLIQKSRTNPEELRDFAKAIRNGTASLLDQRGHQRRRYSGPIESDRHSDEREGLLAQTSIPAPPEDASTNEKLTFTQTARLSLQFSFLWFTANYFIALSLGYTTVASGTILTSTSSVFTLLFGILLRVELFSLRKLAGVLASLLGVILISTIDWSGSTDAHRGFFPHKSRGELLLGDALALAAAVLYGIYAVSLALRLGDESRVSMPAFFGCVGAANCLFLGPGLIILHVTRIEPFALPPTGRIAAIVIFNAAASGIADFCWAWATLLTSPLVVTVGLSLTIPLSLVGQIVLNHQTTTALYWLGAAVVVAGFLIVNGAVQPSATPEQSHQDDEGGRMAEGILGDGER